MKQFLLIIILFSCLISNAQEKEFTRQDTLRGSITKERVWWNLLHYKLDVKVDSEKKYISGSNIIKYEVLKPYQTLQIDLQTPLKITKVIQNNEKLTFKTDGFAHFIELKEKQTIGSINAIQVFYEGNPVQSKNPPWSGGFTWRKDEKGNDFIATSCQGIGASIWWPCKDHMYDEPEKGAYLTVTSPKGLMDVSNGRLVKVVENNDATKTHHWEVVNPINNYGININIGNYVSFSETYKGLNGDLDCSYYVLEHNLEKAKKQFLQVPKMLEAFEHWFGPYPFYEDSFKLVEAPYLGMEHQSSVTYGNKYQNGYLGYDLSQSGWGLKFDFIIIHESGHEWFANSITYKDAADMWIHESFTAYSETLYLTYHYGENAGNEYVIGTRKSIRNDIPIIGIYNVNKEGSGDMYYKGANMIHTFRQLVDDDKKFKAILKGLNTDFYHQTVTSRQIEDYMETKSGLDLKGFFNQYLRTTDIPVLEYKIDKKKIQYRYANTVPNFNIPIKTVLDEKEIWLQPTTEWQTLKSKCKLPDFKVDKNFYLKSKHLKK